LLVGFYGGIMINKILEFFWFNKKPPEKVRLLIRNNEIILAYIPKEIATDHFKMYCMQQQIACYKITINKATNNNGLGALGGLQPWLLSN